ncbi:MAG TPA: hypothetical protein VGT99_10335 [Gammaproteobacteria bacterium]|nr:hypothetical protein [Gammaproteobacteria bacterium]
MYSGDADERSRVWIALGNQPGVSAWFAVWLLSRLDPPAPEQPQKPVPAGAPASRPTRRVRAGTSIYREQPRP